MLSISVRTYTSTLLAGAIATLSRLGVRSWDCAYQDRVWTGKHKSCNCMRSLGKRYMYFIAYWLLLIGCDRRTIKYKYQLSNLALMVLNKGSQAWRSHPNQIRINKGVWKKTILKT
ncbi:MAG: hypothetical protein F6J93_30015 [Oscillatoria sp. SIO1A7]|nr:hypothetical protein [Oscillatoria sp. SIO1A7]